MSDTQVKEGDQGSWQWSGNRPGGPVANVVPVGQPSITANSSNEVSKNAEPSNPAVHVERSGNDVVKPASEVTVEKEGDKHKEAPAPAASKQPENGLENKPVTEAKPKEVAPAIPPPIENKVEEAPKKEPAPVENGDAKIGDKRPAEEPAEEKKDAENGVSDTKKQKTDDAPGQPSLEAISNGTKPEAPKIDTPKKKETPKKESKKREPKRAATETGEPRRSSRHAAK